MSEKQISETERKSKVIQISGKVTQETKDLFDELRESGTYDTFGQFMEALLEHYQNPIKINKENAAKIAELNETIAELKERLDERDKEHLEYIAYNDELIKKVESANAKCEELSKANMQQAGRLQELDGIEHKMDGHILVPVDDLDMRCLQYLADRENKVRHREDITPPVFFQYAVREMLIKGNKFAIDSVPDSKIAQFKSEIANGK